MYFKQECYLFICANYIELLNMDLFIFPFSFISQMKLGVAFLQLPQSTQVECLV